MIITLVEPQKKNPRRFNIYLDGKFGFGADEDTVVKFRLVFGKEIDSSDLDKVLLETQVGKLMGRMYGLLQIRLRSEKEIRDYIRNLNFKKKIKDQEEVSELVIELLMENLKSKGLLNDEAFAKAWVESRRRSKNKGINVIKMELFQKGIDREIVEEVVSSQQSAVSEEDLAKLALERKVRSWRSLSEKEFKQKATDFLMRRGFVYAVAKETVEKYLEKE